MSNFDQNKSIKSLTNNFKVQKKFSIIYFMHSILLVPFLTSGILSITVYFLNHCNIFMNSLTHIVLYCKHGTIIRIGITYKKILCYMRDSACRWFIVKKAKIFWSYAKHFWIFAGVRKCRNLIGLCKWTFSNCPIIFLDWHNKTKLLSASFSCF